MRIKPVFPPSPCSCCISPSGEITIPSLPPQRFTLTVLPLLLAGILLLLLTLMARGQPKQPHSSPWGGTEQVLYINPQHPQAADRNTGTAKFPLKTIAAGLKRAIELRHRGISTQVLIYPGMYRESVAINEKSSSVDRATPNSKAAAVPPIVLEAITGSDPEPAFARGESLEQPAPDNKVILSGSEVWRNWQPYANPPNSNSPIYFHTWNYDWGVAENPWTDYKIELAEIVRRGEMVFVNGQLLRQVLGFDQLQPNSFYIDEDQNRIYLCLKAGQDPNQQTVEVATRKSLLNLTAVDNLTVRGITFQHTAGAFSSAVGLSHASGLLMQNCQFRWNNWQGLSLGDSQQISLHHNQLSHNGEKGMVAYRIKNLEIQDHETSHNNWRGGWGQFYDWDAGEKFFHIHGGRFVRYRAIANLAAGLWLDTDNRDIVIEQALLANNAVVGLFLEAGEGPITIKNSVIANNYQIAPNYLQTPGLFAWSAANVTVENNLIFGNESAQVGIRDLYPRQLEGRPDQEGTVVSRNWVFQHNRIITTSPDQRLLVTLKAAPFLSSLRSQQNLWSIAPQTAEPPRPWQIDQTKLTFSEWQAHGEHDRDSLFLTSPTEPPQLD